VDCAGGLKVRKSATPRPRKVALGRAERVGRSSKAAALPGRMASGGEEGDGAHQPGGGSPSFGAALLTSAAQCAR
ncbi:hypothetical protein ACU686_21200, partial [Yinghuangia aomiensis]